MKELSEQEAVLHIFGHWHRWLLVQRALSWTLRGFLAATFISLIPAVLLLRGARIIEVEFFYLLTASGLAGAALGALGAVLRRPSSQKNARRLDRSLNLQDRLSTSLEILSAPVHPSPQIWELQIADTRRAIEARHPREQLRWRPGRLEGAAGLALAAAVALLFWSGRTAMQKAELNRAVMAQVDAEAAELLELISEIETGFAGDPPELLETLRSAQAEVGQAETLEQAVSALDRALAEVEVFNNGDARSSLSALESSAAEAQAQQPSEQLAQLNDRLAAGDLDGAARALSDLDVEALSEHERAALAEQLAASADRLPAEASDLAAALDQAAESLQQGDSAGQAQALAELADQLDDLESQILAAELAEAAQDRLAASQGRLLEAAGNAPVADADGGDAGDGGDLQVPPQAGSRAGDGSGQGTAEGADGQESWSSANPILPETYPGDGGLGDYERIYAPDYLPGSGGDPLPLPGGNAEGLPLPGEGLPSEEAQDGVAGVPYLEVYPEYLEIYLQNIQSGEIPPHLRDLVRVYFGSLEP